MKKNQGRCVDCKKDTYKIKEYYMVLKRVWKKAGLEPNGGMLCIGCLEKRLGRTLCMSDFTFCPLNVINYCGDSSARLLSRMSATKPMPL